MPGLQLSRGAHVVAPKGERTSYEQPSRVGKKTLICWVDEEKHRALKIAAVENDVTLAQIFEDALDLWIAKHGKKGKR